MDRFTPYLPEDETPFIPLPAGYAAEGTLVPDIRRKPPNEIMVYI